MLPSEGHPDRHFMCGLLFGIRATVQAVRYALYLFDQSIYQAHTARTHARFLDFFTMSPQPYLQRRNLQAIMGAATCPCLRRVWHIHYGPRCHPISVPSWVPLYTDGKCVYAKVYLETHLNQFMPSLFSPLASRIQGADRCTQRISVALHTKENTVVLPFQCCFHGC